MKLNITLKDPKEIRRKRENEFFSIYRWKRTYKHIKYRCKPNALYGKKGIKNLITEEELKKLWFRDKGWLMKAPSIDRINNKGHYTYDNCRYIERAKNAWRNHPIIAVQQYSLDGKLVATFKSVKEAASNFGKYSSGLTRTANGKQNHYCGYKWKYIWFNKNC